MSEIHKRRTPEGAHERVYREVRRSDSRCVERFRSIGVSGIAAQDLLRVRDEEVSMGQSDSVEGFWGTCPTDQRASKANLVEVRAESDSQAHRRWSDQRPCEGRGDHP